jgi:hypothetical protein
MARRAGDGGAGGAGAIERAARRCAGSSRLPSGAGHDAQMMARLGPMGMIFVPSVGGVSHSPKELTTGRTAQRRDVLLRHDPRCLAASRDCCGLNPATRSVAEGFMSYPRIGRTRSWSRTRIPSLAPRPARRTKTGHPS